MGLFQWQKDNRVQPLAHTDKLTGRKCIFRHPPPPPPPAQTLVSGNPLEHLGGQLGPVHRLLLKRLRQWKEVKWLAKGILQLPQQQDVEGWVIHEEVHFIENT